MARPVASTQGLCRALGQACAAARDDRSGESEGAAGSIYYTAPVTIIDGARRLTGEVVLRRVNDVPGATPEQLRWHIESTTGADARRRPC
jgi:hypothetical protein